jgi:hypothetical protein
VVDQVVPLSHGCRRHRGRLITSIVFMSPRLMLLDIGFLLAPFPPDPLLLAREGSGGT